MLAFQGRPATQSTSWTSNQAFQVEINDKSFTRPVQVTKSERSVSYPDLVAGTSGRIFLAWTASAQDGTQAFLSRGWLK